MIIQTIALSILAVCNAQQESAIVRVPVEPIPPARHWPEPQERPEKTEPPHGEGSGESPIFGGMAVYGANINVSNTASVTVGLSPSGVSPYASVAWLPNRLPLIVSPREFDIEPLLSASLPNVIQVGPDTKSHLNNPSTIRIRESVTRPKR